MEQYGKHNVQKMPKQLNPMSHPTTDISFAGILDEQHQ
jgi:hypothetical protein